MNAIFVGLFSIQAKSTKYATSIEVLANKQQKNHEWIRQLSSCSRLLFSLFTKQLETKKGLENGGGLGG